MPSFPQGTQAGNVKVDVLTGDNFNEIEGRVNSWLARNKTTPVYGVSFVARGNHVAAYISYFHRRS